MCICYLTKALVKGPKVIEQSLVIVKYCDWYFQDVNIRANRVLSVGLKNSCKKAFQKGNKPISQASHDELNKLDCSFNFRILIMNNIFGLPETFHNVFPNRFGKLDQGVFKLVFLFICHKDFEEGVKRRVGVSFFDSCGWGEHLIQNLQYWRQILLHGVKIKPKHVHNSFHNILVPIMIFQQLNKVLDIVYDYLRVLLTPFTKRSLGSLLNLRVCQVRCYIHEQVLDKLTLYVLVGFLYRH